MGRATRWFKDLFGIKSKEKGSAKTTGMCHNPSTIPPNITPAEAAWLRSFYSESDTDQNKHAIAVAAATAAAADAAVAAANAAVEVVRLTSQAGRGSREKLAVLKIQNVFRGYLARKALRALKGLVKIQALVRGFLVRKQATATLHGMQALIRVQARVRARAKKTRDLLLITNEDNFSPQYHPRKSLENIDDTGCEHPNSMHSRRLSASFEATNAAATNSFDESPKIVEVDTGCRPKSRSKRTNTMLDSNEDSFGKAPSRIPSRISIPDTPNIPSQESGFIGDECHFPTAQSTPRFANSCSCNTPTTPAKSMCTESYFRSHGEHPNYMAKTQSFKAKLRSQSAPRQRHEPGPKRRLSLHEMLESRSSLSGVRMQRSCSEAQQETLNFKNAVMGKLSRSSDFS